MIWATIAGIVVAVVVGSIAISGIGSSGSTSDSVEKLTVISSFYPIYEFTNEVGGTKIDSSLLIPPGAEPHDWEPTVQDVQRLQNADVIVINGVGFETWVEDLEEGEFNGVIVDTSNGIKIIGGHDEHDDDHKDERDEHDDEHDDERHEDDHDDDHKDEHGHDHSAGDPHIWLNPVLAQIQIQNIADALSDQDPENREYYQTRAEQYNAKLANLDDNIRNTLANCNHDYIAFHDAFTYFSNEYGLRYHNILSSLDPHGEVTAQTLENIITTAKRLDVDVIFAEEQYNERASQVIADELDGQVLPLSPLEISSDEDYISRMTTNLQNLEVALCR